MKWLNKSSQVSEFVDEIVEQISILTFQHLDQRKLYIKQRLVKNQIYGYIQGERADDTGGHTGSRARSNRVICVNPMTLSNMFTFLN
jgi:hypothetical protein